VERGGWWGGGGGGGGGGGVGGGGGGGAGWLGGDLPRMKARPQPKPTTNAPPKQNPKHPGQCACCASHSSFQKKAR
jgi:hypothetical protein